MEMQTHSLKPRLSFWQLWNMSFGFFGIQIAFGLQNANASRIFQTLGAEIDAVVKEPATQARIAELGGMPPGLTPDGGTTPAAFDEFVRAEIAKWGEVVCKSGASAE